MIRQTVSGENLKKEKTMSERICPMCGIGLLRESTVTGYECSSCGEVFTIGEKGELEVVSYEEWLKSLNRKKT